MALFDVFFVSGRISGGDAIGGVGVVHGPWVCHQGEYLRSPFVYPRFIPVWSMSNDHVTRGRLTQGNRHRIGRRCGH